MSRRSPHGFAPIYRVEAGLITIAVNKPGAAFPLKRHSTAHLTAAMQHRSVHHHHVAGRSMTRNVCLLPPPTALQLANQPGRPHTGRWECLQRSRRTNLARSPRKGAHSQSTTLKDTLRRMEPTRKANLVHTRMLQGKAIYTVCCPTIFSPF